MLYLSDYLPASGGISCYRCASVDTANHTWTGYLADIDASTGAWSFASVATAGLAYANRAPLVGKVYAGNPYIFEVAAGIPWIPAAGLLCSALPDPNWVVGQYVSQWGDFSQSDSAKKPQIAAMGGVVGIKAHGGDEMTASASAITDDFTYLAKFYASSLDYYSDFSLITDNENGGAIICFGTGDGSTDVLLLSKQGVSADLSNLEFNHLLSGRLAHFSPDRTFSGICIGSSPFRTRPPAPGSLDRNDEFAVIDRLAEGVHVPHFVRLMYVDQHVRISSAHHSIPAISSAVSTRS